MARKYKKRDTRKRRTETALKWMIYPPVVVGALLFGTGKRKKRGKKK